MTTPSTPDRPRLRLAWLLFAAFSLIAVLTGFWVAHLHGAPNRVWMMNLAAWAVGAALAVLMSRGGPRLVPAWPVVAFAALAATFVSPGLSGVHRWIGLGPLRLNAAELFLPATLAGLTIRSWTTLVPTLAAAILLAVQPDASQAVALAASSMAALMMTGRVSPGRIAAALLVATTAVVACLRPDPLAPVPEVEGILQLAMAVSPVLAALAVLSLAGAVLSPLLLARSGASSAVRAAAVSLTTYLALSALAPALGAFPVPLVGMGVSPILGAWLGLGALMGLPRRA
jgi:hypothetical protein